MSTYVKRRVWRLFPLHDKLLVYGANSFASDIAWSLDLSSLDPLRRVPFLVVRVRVVSFEGTTAQHDEFWPVFHDWHIIIQLLSGVILMRSLTDGSALLSFSSVLTWTSHFVMDHGNLTVVVGILFSFQVGILLLNISPRRRGSFVIPVGSLRALYFTLVEVVIYIVISELVLYFPQDVIKSLLVRLLIALPCFIYVSLVGVQF